METPKGSTELIKYGLIAGIAYFGIIRPLMQKLGVTDTEADQKDEKSGDKAMNPNDAVGKWFTASTYQAWKNAGFKPGAKILGASISQVVQNMEKALSTGGIIFKFDAAAIIAVIASLPSKYALAQLSMEYQKKTGRDLISDINNRMTANIYGTEGAMTRIYSAVNALPTTG